MSLLHDALKKAEKNGSSVKSGDGVYVDSEQPVGRSHSRVFLLSAVASALLLFLAYQRFVKKTSPAPVPLPYASAVVPAVVILDGGKLMQEASRLIQDERYGEAKVNLEKAVVTSLPNEKAAEAYNNLGFVLKKLGQNEEAFQNYQKALSLNPQCVECRNNLGVLYLASRDFTEAESNFQEAMKLKPDYAEPYFHMALLMEARGDLTAAKTYYNRYTELAHGVNADFLLKIQERMAATEVK